MNKKNQVKILVLSEGPPPIGEAKVEGGGLRAWGISRSLAEKGNKVTYSYKHTFEKVDNKIKLPENIKVIQWNSDNIKEILNDHTHIILRYSMGEMGLFIDNINEEKILIADCYIPISVEVSARESKDVDNELRNYISDTYWWQRCIRRSDYILYASEQQLNYYLGYLSAILKLNPASYNELSKRLILLPYGYFKNDIQKKIKKNITPSLVWYGGIYPWFNMKPVIEAAKLLKKEYPEFRMIIAGAKNPYTDNKDFLEHYKKSMNLVEEIKDFTEIIGHTPYEERFDIYNKGSTIITLNKDGLENNLAWRTRLADYIAARKPVITNGGDPLGEMAIENGNAVRISSIDSPESIKKAFEKSLEINIQEDNKLVKYLCWENNIDILNLSILNSSRLDPKLSNISLELLKRKKSYDKLKQGISYSFLVLKEEGPLTLIKKIGRKLYFKLKKS